MKDSRSKERVAVRLMTCLADSSYLKIVLLRHRITTQRGCTIKAIGAFEADVVFTGGYASRC